MTFIFLCIMAAEMNILICVWVALCTISDMQTASPMWNHLLSSQIIGAGTVRWIPAITAPEGSKQWEKKHRQTFTTKKIHWLPSPLMFQAAQSTRIWVHSKTPSKQEHPQSLQPDNVLPSQKTCSHCLCHHREATTSI